ncbi:MAG: DUF4176 domain-containing protein [Lachnospiraceae bacterium]|jgi:hypothetical protein
MSEYLPIGSVVELQDSENRVMVIGYLSLPRSMQENGTTVFDYCGVPFPQGYIADDAILSFNADQIVDVLAYGYRDIEVDELYARIDAILEQAGQASGDADQAENPDQKDSTD